MATLRDVYNCRFDVDLRTRIFAQVLITSKAVLSESAATPNHTERLASAKACLSSESYLESFVNVVMFSAAANDSIATSPNTATDSTLQWLVETDGAYTLAALTCPA